METSDLIKQLKERYIAKQFKVPDMVKATGINGDKIHKWLQGKGNPKPPEDKLVEDFLNGRISKIPTVYQENNLLTTAAESNNHPATLNEVSVLNALILKRLKEIEENLSGILTNINSGLSQNLGVGQSNNSLLRSVLLSQAQQLSADHGNAKDIFDASLRVAEDFLNKTYRGNVRDRSRNVKKAH